MKYFYDTEFIEDGKSIDLISIGIVAEDGRQLYCESYEADLDKASDWVKENVIKHLWSKQQDKAFANSWILAGNIGGLVNRNVIANEIRRFCNPDKYGKPEFWAYYADYDHVALCQLFGTMMDLPNGWPMYTRDVKQYADYLGNPRLPEQGKDEHHALADATWTKTAYEYLCTFEYENNLYNE